MIVDSNTWHYRWYAYWLRCGRGTAPSYRENLCHYVRVLLFWAPMTWIDQHTSWDWGKLSERVSFGVVILSFGGAVLFLLTLAMVTQTAKFLLAIGSLAGLVGCIGFVVLSVRTMQGGRLEIPGTVKLGAAYVVAKKRRICPFITFTKA